MRNRGKVVQVEKVRILGKTYELKLRLVDHGSSRSGRFTYAVTHDDPAVEVDGEDLSACIKEAERVLTEKLSVVWIPSIAIYADAGDLTVYCGSGETLFAGRMSLRYSTIDVAKRQDGTNLWRERVRSGTVVTSFHRSHIEHDGIPSHATAVIPDTPENRAKLQVIADGLEKLGANLTLLLGQDRIVKTLQDVRTLQLPAPAPAAPSKRVTRKKKP